MSPDIRNIGIQCIYCRWYARWLKGTTAWSTFRVFFEVEGFAREWAANHPICAKHKPDVAAAFLRIKGVG